MALALDDIPLHAVGVGDGEERVPVHRSGAGLAIRIASGLTEDRVELLDALAHSVLLRVERRRAVGILLVLDHRVDAGDHVAGAGRPADVLLHADRLVGVGEEVVPERGAVLHEDRMLPRMVVEADLDAKLGGVDSRLVVELDELLGEVVDLLRGLAGLSALTGRPAASGREVAAAGADDEGVAVAELELRGLLEDLGVVRELLHVEAILVVADVRAAHDKPGVREHLPKLCGVRAVVARELHSLEADFLDLEKRLRKRDLADLVLGGNPLVE